VRILLVTDWPAVDGGVETYLEQLAGELTARGHVVAFLTGDHGRGRDVAIAVARSPEALPAKALTQVVNPFAYQVARKAVASFRPDVAFVTMFEMALSPAVVFGLGEVPYVHNIAYYKPVCPTGLKLLPDGRICNVLRGRPCRQHGCLSAAEAIRSTVRYALIDKVVRGAAQRITCSDWMRTVLAQNGVDATHVPWPVRPPPPGYERRRAVLPVVVAAGRLSPEKGLDTLVEAIDLLRRRGIVLRARLVGEGPERTALELQAFSAGVADLVEIVGWRPGQEVDKEMSAAWAVVAPSRWAEPLGLSVLEAIVRGVPAVGSATGGYAETIEPRLTGLLARNGDAGSWAAALEEIAKDTIFPGGVVDPGAAARARSRHDPGVHLEAIVSILEEAVGW
jgi:glycosyltransferase involved in cell wall biosynthesis